MTIQTTPPTKNVTLSLDDYLQLTALMFSWGDSYDSKDWDRLRTIIAPTLMIDYRRVMGDQWFWEAMPAEDYMRMVSDPGFLGDPLVKTQHLLGATKWEQLSETEVIGHHQLRAAHNRFTDLTLQRVDRRGHGHATNEHFYKRINGTWKFAGLRPTVRWNEYDFEHIFKGIKFEDYAPKNDKKEEIEEPSACATENGENGINGAKNEMSHVNGTTSTSNEKYLDFVV